MNKQVMLVALCAVLLGGCTGTTREAQTALVRQEVKQGIEGGQPVNVVTTVREQMQEQSQAQTSVDASASINATLAALKGDLPGLVKAAVSTSLDVMKPASTQGTDWLTLGAGALATFATGYGATQHLSNRKLTGSIKKLSEDEDEAWALNQRALAMLPPDQAAKVLGST